MTNVRAKCPLFPSQWQGLEGGGRTRTQEQHCVGSSHDWPRVTKAGLVWDVLPG